MIFDHEWRGDAAPYAGRHRKGWRAAMGTWGRGYLQRVRAERDPALPAAAPRAHRGSPAQYYDHGSRGR